MIARREVDVDGIRLSFLERGKASKSSQSLVLVHGLMGCAEIFVPLLQSLGGDDLHVIAIDLPGAGQSERREDIDASLCRTAKLVERMLEMLQIRRPVLLGHSHGGAVAMRLATRDPDALRALILLSPAHPYFTGSDPLIGFYLSLPGRIFAYTMPWFPQWLQMMGLRSMAGKRKKDTRDDLRPYRENLRRAGTVSHLLNLLRTWDKDMSDLRYALRQPLDIPTLILWGDCDRAVPLHSAEDLRQHLHHCELIALAGIGHRPAEEDPQLVGRLIRSWIERLQDATTGSGALHRPNSSVSQSRMARFITSNLEAGD